MSIPQNNFQYNKSLQANDQLICLKMIILFVFGCIYIVSIPVFEGPDEPAHLARAYGISEGQFVLKDNPR